MSSSEKEEPRTLVLVHTRLEEPLVYLCQKSTVGSIQSRSFTNPGWEPRRFVYSLRGEDQKDLLAYSGASWGGLLLKKEWSSIEGTQVDRYLQGILQVAGNEGLGTRKEMLSEAVQKLNQALNEEQRKEELKSKSTGN